jgi:hypothetical protein
MSEVLTAAIKSRDLQAISQWYDDHPDDDDRIKCLVQTEPPLSVITNALSFAVDQDFLDVAEVIVRKCPSVKDQMILGKFGSVAMVELVAKAGYRFPVREVVSAYIHGDPLIVQRIWELTPQPRPEIGIINSLRRQMKKPELACN